MRTPPRLRDTAALAIFLTVSCAALILNARSKPLWYDEIHTVIAARLPSVQVLWRAHRDGLDLAPPFCAVLTRAAIRLFGVGPVSVRLPALASFLLTLAIVFEFVRRRSHAAMAISGCVLLCFSAAWRYGIEARGYAPMVASFAAALYAWSESASGRRRAVWLPVLAVALAAGFWSHYFAAFAYLPIVAGELVRTVRRRQIDWPIWCAVGTSVALVLPLLPLIRSTLGHTGVFWSLASQVSVAQTYRFLFEPLLSGTFMWVAIFVLVAIAIGRVGRFRRPAAMVPAHEATALALALALPLVELWTTRLAGTGFTPRYGLCATAALAIGAPLLIWTGGKWTGFPVAAVLAGVFGLTMTQMLEQPRRPSADPVAARPQLRELATGGGPVVITGPLPFLQFWYYAPPETRRHLWYVADPAESLRYTGSDSVDRELQALARWVAANVSDYRTFVERHDRFVVYAAGSGWVLHRLTDDRAVVVRIGRELGADILDVRVR